MKLEVAVAEISQAQKDLTIEVAAEEVKAAFDKTYAAFARKVKVPGFRPGRTPREVLKQRFSHEVKEQVGEQLVTHALQHAIVDSKLRVVGQPVLKDISVSEGEPAKFTVSVEVLPDFELKEYKGLKITKRVETVADEDVEKVITRWRESAAEFVPVEDRPSQAGDFVSVNLVGKYLDPQAKHEKEDLIAEEVQIELGGEGVQPEFDENLRGVKSEDVREFRVSYPEDFSSKGLAGKTLDFKATVAAVRRKEIPEANDDFAQESGEYESIDQLREKLRENLLKEVDRRAEARLRTEVVERLADAYDFEVPPSLVEEQAVSRVRELAYHMVQQGFPPQSINQMNWGERIDEARPGARREIRSALVIGRIGEAEDVTVTENEIDAEIARVATEHGESPAQMKARLTKEDALSSIENSLRYQKTLDAIVNSAEITTEELVVEKEKEPETLASPEPESTIEKQAAEQS